MARDMKSARDKMAWSVRTINQHDSEAEKTIMRQSQDGMNFINGLISQATESIKNSVELKTPRVLRKKQPIIETIPEDSVIEIDNSHIPNSTVNIQPTRIRSSRVKAQEATAAIKKMNELSNKTKLRNETFINTTQEVKKKQKNESTGSTQSDSELPVKSKKAASNNKVIQKDGAQELESSVAESVNVTLRQSSSRSKRKRDTTDVTVIPSSEVEDTPKNKKMKNNSPVTRSLDEDPSLYEDAIEKPNVVSPPLNSSILATNKRVLNATVVLERLPVQKFGQISNDTFVVQNPLARSSPLSKRGTRSSKGEASLNSLITDDESSSDRKSRKFPPPKKVLTKKPKTLKKRKTRSSLESTDEDVFASPKMPVLKETNKPFNFKSPALFSPYSKESVKNRVQAFEQAQTKNDVENVEVEVQGGRVTRTKTRALAAIAAAESEKLNKQSAAQLRARKSLVWAKKISEAKHEKEEVKENRALELKKKQNKHNVLETTSVKNALKGTPVSKKLPVAIGRLQQTPINKMTTPYSQQASARRNNIVSGIESFITIKSSSKRESEKQQMEKRQKVDYDAKRKRDEALQKLAEEKKRKREQKELKNKIAREAKEKLEAEKRMKAEKEREEKAKLAALEKDKQREEAERKKAARLLHIQEKNKKRSLEEQQRLRRQLEQEEAERQLAENKKNELEAERRKNAEQRALQQAAEMKNKALLQAQAAAKAKAAAKQPPTTYKLDSEPDDDDTDDEAEPKYEVPLWATSSVRANALKMQAFVPSIATKKLYNSQRCTPDLSDLFQGINKNRLKRTSSAIWKIPPRFSHMAE